MSKTFGSLMIKKAIALPLAVESHAIAQEWNEELWLLINQPGRKKSQVLKVTSSHELQVISSLPIIAASVIECDQQMIITGANPNGQPIVFGINSEGEIIWKYSFSGVVPITWPLAACGDRVMLAWQQTPDKIETGLLDPKSSKLLLRDPVIVQSQPAKIFAFKDKLLVGWSEKTGIHIIKLLAEQEQVLLSNEVQADAFSVGECKEGIYFGWRIGNHAYWLLPFTKLPSRIDLGNINGGTFNLVKGGDPLIWVQKSVYGIDGDLQWTSNLISQKRNSYTVEGYVYAVLWWNQMLVIVNQSKLLFLNDSDR